MLGAAAADYELVSIDEKLAEQVLGKESDIIIYIVDPDGKMISASVPGVAVVNNEQQYANTSDNTVIVATANYLVNQYGSWANASASDKEVVVSVPDGLGLFWAKSEQLEESHGLTWHVVVAERIGKPLYRNESLDSHQVTKKTQKCSFSIFICSSLFGSRLRRALLSI